MPSEGANRHSDGGRIAWFRRLGEEGGNQATRRFPRGGTLCVMESGKGMLSRIDVGTGAVTPVAELPGFTRGLSFIGRYALVGLSQVRESVFSSLPITARASERNCGVWLVDTLTGEIVGFLKFDGVVQEIFEVTVLPHRWPVIVRDEGIAKDSFVLPDEALAQVVRAG